MTLELIRQRWIAERPSYERFCQQVSSVLRRIARQRGLRCEVYSRAKTIDSLLKKTLKKDYQDPYDDIHDKAGVRVVCSFADSIPDLKSAIRESFVVLDYDDKGSSLGNDRLGYSGIHFEVTLRPEDSESDSGLEDKICEIQLLSEGQHVWANTSHYFLYKAAVDPPDSIKRSVFRLQGHLDVYDLLVTQARRELLAISGFQEAVMLEELEKHFYRFTAEDYDRELSLYILDALKSLFTESELAGFAALLDDFVKAKESVLNLIYEDYSGDAYRSPLLFQPETIAIFFWFEKDRYRLKAVWEGILPLEELQRLADVWVVDIGLTI